MQEHPSRAHGHSDSLNGHELQRRKMNPLCSDNYRMTLAGSHSWLSRSSTFTFYVRALKDGELLALWLLQECLYFRSLFLLGGYLCLGIPVRMFPEHLCEYVHTLCPRVHRTGLSILCQAHLVHLKRGGRGSRSLMVLCF